MVVLSLKSKRFNCTLELKEKVTFVVGNSGSGKTEMVRRLESNSSSKKIEITDNYSYEVLNGKRFGDICNTARRHIQYKNGIELTEFDKLDGKIKKKYYMEYWKEYLNFPFNDSILIVDDEDFVDSVEFQAFFDSDISNYYLIINRLHLDKIGYAVSEVYDYKVDGTNHYLEKRYKLPENSNRKIDFVITEGVGSDYIFFRSWLGEKVVNPTLNDKIKSGGRTNVARMIEANKELFRNKKILILIDYVAYGANLKSLVDICEEINVDFYIESMYKSFEYLLLKSNMISDMELDNYVENNRLKFNSLETLYTYRLKELTKGTLLSYKKKSEEFSVCYYKECCSNSNYRQENCKYRTDFYKKSKHLELLINTEFSDFIDLCME